MYFKILKQRITDPWRAEGDSLSVHFDGENNECWNQKPLIKYLKYCSDCPHKLDHLYKRESYTYVKKTEKILRF